MQTAHVMLPAFHSPTKRTPHSFIQCNEEAFYLAFLALTAFCNCLITTGSSLAAGVFWWMTKELEQILSPVPSVAHFPILLPLTKAPQAFFRSESLAKQVFSTYAKSRLIAVTLASHGAPPDV